MKTYLKITSKINTNTIIIREVSYKDGMTRYVGGLTVSIPTMTEDLPIDARWNYDTFTFDVITEAEAFLEML